MRAERSPSPWGLDAPGRLRSSVRRNGVSTRSKKFPLSARSTRATVSVACAPRTKSACWEESCIRLTIAVGSVPYLAANFLMRSASSRCSGVTGCGPSLFRNRRLGAESSTPEVDSSTSAGSSLGGWSSSDCPSSTDVSGCGSCPMATSVKAGESITAPRSQANANVGLARDRLTTHGPSCGDCLLFDLGERPGPRQETLSRDGTF